MFLVMGLLHPSPAAVDVVSDSRLTVGFSCLADALSPSSLFISLSLTPSPWCSHSARLLPPNACHGCLPLWRSERWAKCPGWALGSTGRFYHISSALDLACKNVVLGRNSTCSHSLRSCREWRVRGHHVNVCEYPQERIKKLESCCFCVLGVQTSLVRCVLSAEGPAKFWLLGSCKELEKFTLKFGVLPTSTHKWKAGGVRAEMNKENLSFAQGVLRVCSGCTSQ